MDPVRVGVIGLGNIGLYHTQYLRRGDVPQAVLAAVCERSPERLAPFAHDGLATFADSQDLIHSGLVDAVLIATPHPNHVSTGIAALEQGLHVMVEKPLGVHVADCQRLIAARQNEKQVLGVMLNKRLTPAFAKLKQLIDEGELGTIYRANWISTAWFRPQSYYDSSSWRAMWQGEGGGVLINQCVHDLDLLQWLVGMPSKVHGFCGLGKHHHIETEDEVTAYMTWDDGLTGVFICSTGEAPGTNRLELACERGRVVLEDEHLTFDRSRVSVPTFSKEMPDPFGYPEIWKVEIPTPSLPESHAQMTANFCDAILTGAPLLAPAEEGVHSVELVNAILHSHFEAAPCELPLDGVAYEAHLQQLIAESTFEKKVTEARIADVSKSFR